FGFSPAAIYPCYGLAEATLLVSAGRRGGGALTRTVSRRALALGRVDPPAEASDSGTLVSCGRRLPGERLAIVDPERLRPLAAGTIGEIWVSGPHVAGGYWRHPLATASTFQARLATDAEVCWLRTGDLGFVDEAGQLYITGRIKDVIIIRGMNH